MRFEIASMNRCASLLLCRPCCTFALLLSFTQRQHRGAAPAIPRHSSIKMVKGCLCATRSAPSGATATQ